MDLIGEFARRLLAQLLPVADWLLNNWAAAMLLVVALLYGAGRQRRLYRSRR